MIKTFRSKETEKVLLRHRSPRFSADVHRVALRKLILLDAAEKLEDLRIPLGKRLEKLTGYRQGQHSICINDQWRICYRWSEGDAYDVEIADYHEGVTIMKTRVLAPIHPGKILMEEFLKPVNISQYKLAKDIDVPARRINEIVHGKLLGQRLAGRPKRKSAAQQSERASCRLAV